MKHIHTHAGAPPRRPPRRPPPAPAPTTLRQPHSNRLRAGRAPLLPRAGQLHAQEIQPPPDCAPTGGAALSLQRPRGAARPPRSGGGGRARGGEFVVGGAALTGGGGGREVGWGRWRRWRRWRSGDPALLRGHDGGARRQPGTNITTTTSNNSNCNRRIGRVNYAPPPVHRPRRHGPPLRLRHRHGRVHQEPGLSLPGVA